MAVDVHFDKRVLLLHFDGSNGSTTFTDGSRYGQTCTAVGNAQITTAQSVFGGASGDFDGAGDSVDVTYTADLNLAGGDWCVEGRARVDPSITTGAGILVDFRGTSGAQNSSWVLFVDYAQRAIGVYDGTVNIVIPFTPNNALPTHGTWFSWAASQQSGVTRLFVDGVLVASSSSFTTPATHSSGLRIGLQYDNTNPWKGQKDELRITKGRAERTATYTLDGSAFSEERGGFTLADGPLAAPTLVGYIEVRGYVAAASPLGSPALYIGLVWGRSSAESPLGQPRLSSQLVWSRASAPSVLGSAAVFAYHDFTPNLDLAASITYVMDLTTPGGLVRVPISSWQATISAGEASYLQCVIPAATPWVPSIEVATSFAVSRRTLLTTGQAYEYEMFSAPTETFTLDQGGRRHTATLSGYTSPYPAATTPTPSLDRPLNDVRLSSYSGGRKRVQCGIDWMLRPGQRAVLDGEPFVVDYINYYCAPTGESMIVGEAEA